MQNSLIVNSCGLLAISIPVSEAIISGSPSFLSPDLSIFLLLENRAWVILDKVFTFSIDKNLIDRVFKYASVKNILDKNTVDDEKVENILSEVVRDLKNYELEIRIQDLEEKFSKDLSEDTFNQLKELKKLQNLN